MSRHIVLLDQPPEAWADPREAVDPILARVALGVPVVMIALDGGVGWLNSVAAAPLGQLAFFDGWDLLVEQESLRQATPDGTLEARSVPRNEMSGLFAEAGSCLHIVLGSPGSESHRVRRARVGDMAPMVWITAQGARPIDSSGGLHAPLTAPRLVAMLEDHEHTLTWRT